MSRLVARVAAILGFLLITPGLASAISSTATIHFAGAGPGTPNGYEKASVLVEYSILICPGGQLTIAARRQKNSLTTSPRYWVDGVGVETSIPPPEIFTVEFSGRIVHGGMEIGRFEYLDGKGGGVHGLGLNCFSGDTRAFGKLSEHLSTKATDAERRNFLAALEIRVDEQYVNYLTNRDIEDHVRAAKRKAEAEKKAKEKRERKEKEKTEQERKEREEAERRGKDQAKAQGRSEKDSAKSQYAEGDFWGTGGGSGSGNDGGSKKPERGARSAENAAERQRREREESYGRLIEAEKRRQEERERVGRIVEKRVSALAQSYYAAQAVGSSMQNMKVLSQLDGNYATAEELEADFNARMQGLQAEMRNLEAAQEQSIQASKQMYFEDDDAIGEAVGIIGRGIAQSIRQSEMEEAKQRLRRQREEMHKRIAEQRKAAMIDMRNLLFAQFPDGNGPLSSHNVDSDILYFFSYTFDQGQIDHPRPNLYLSNVFPVHRYGDKTWPFKHAINKDIQKRAQGKNTLMGFYASESLATEMRDSFLKLAKVNELQVTEFEYAGRVPRKSAFETGGTSEQVDFWETKGAPQSEASTDFW